MDNDDYEKVPYTEHNNRTREPLPNATDTVDTGLTGGIENPIVESEGRWRSMLLPLVSLHLLFQSRGRMTYVVNVSLHNPIFVRDRVKHWQCKNHGIDDLLTCDRIRLSHFRRCIPLARSGDLVERTDPVLLETGN